MHGCGWCLSWAWDGEGVEALNVCIRNRKTACPKFEGFLHLHPFPRVDNQTLWDFAYRQIAKISGNGFKRLEQKQPDGQTEILHHITASPRHTKHKMTLSNDAGRNISRCNDEVDVRLSSS